MKNMMSVLKILKRYVLCRRLSLVLALLAPASAYSDALDQAVADDVLLRTVAEALNAYDIDVAHNLNDRSVARGRINRPRLGRFPDIPQNLLANSIELNAFETEFSNSTIGAMAILSSSATDDAIGSANEFLSVWLNTTEQDRQFVTYLSEDSEAAEKIATVVGAYGYEVLIVPNSDVNLAGNFYATAAQRMAIDSREARRYRTEVTELSYLGERVRRNSNSLFREGGDNRIARNEPSVFLKETLGDEFNQSTIREIIVPGGVALGETASIPFTVQAMQYKDGKLELIDESGETWQLPAIDRKTVKALFDFVERSEAIQSDAIVDIDEERRVKISSSLRDTDAGYQILHADTMPFEYVSNLNVTKSVIIDIAVDWETETNQQLGFETEYEVRFLSADNMRIAQTRVALEYEYASGADSSEYQDAWGRDVRRLRENLDYAGLGDSMGEVAHYAGWAALFRRLKEEQVPFLTGRYEFMKLDKTGQETPSRY